MTELHLSSNAIGDIGADALGKGLKENSRLTRMHLSGNSIDVVVVTAIEDALKENQR